MGLFGMFGSKEAKEEKAFWKAYKTAYSSQKESNLKELLNALTAYPAGWQGYWLAGMYYDMGLGKVAVDENKAKEYQFKAENAAKGTEYEGWVNSFYDWYQQDAIDRCRNLDEITLKIRRLAVAAIHTYEYNKNVLSQNDDANFWYKIFFGFDSKYINETIIFSELFSAWESSGYEELNQKVKKTSKLIDRANKSIRLAREEKVTKSGYSDMAVYLLGYCALNESPYVMDLAAEKSGQNKVVYGVEKLLSAVNMGSAPAVHDLIRMAYASESNYKSIESICQNFFEDDVMTLELLILRWINDCQAAGDREVDRLYELYIEK